MAVDVRAEAIFLAGLAGTAEQPRLSLFQQIPRERGAEASPSSLAEELAPPVEANDLEGAPTSTLLYRPDINFILTEAPDVARAEWRSALRWRVRDLLDFPADQAVIDAFPVPIQPSGEGPQAFVVAARQDTVRERVTQLSEAGLDARFVDIPDMAHRNLAWLLPEPAYGTCLVILDERSSLISITKGGELTFCRQIGLEVGQELNRVAEELGVEPEEAQRQRVEDGLAAGGSEPEGGQLGGPTNEELALEEEGEATAPSTALTDFADRLALEIQRSLDYYDSRFRQAAIQKIYLGGEGARIQGLEAYLEEALGIAFEFFHPLDYLQAEAPIADHRGEVGFPVHEGILAIGAGLRMLDPGTA
ncbi:pilus assembly protein PilM [Thiohalorhabdus sp.]|uniref:pilus assembly protein PilM n=1 Tax=Thiohalorhabdus sp. TaxID=3094134 RepID=UPI002FC2E4B9